MVKVLLFSFEPSFGQFTMLLVEGSSETGLFRHLSNRISCSPYVQNYFNYERQIFLKRFKIESKFRKFKEKTENIFRFRDKCYYNLKIFL